MHPWVQHWLGGGEMRLVVARGAITGRVGDPHCPSGIVPVSGAGWFRGRIPAGEEAVCSRAAGRSR
jgi:hypothetical protein